MPEHIKNTDTNTEKNEKTQQSENRIQEFIKLLNSLKNTTGNETIKNNEKIEQIEVQLDAIFLSGLEEALKKVSLDDLNNLGTAIEDIPDFDEDGTYINKLYKIYKKVYNIKNDSDKKENNEKEGGSSSKEGGNGQPEIEMTFENLPVLDTNSIKKVFSNLDKQNIVKFFNEQKVRTDLTDPQKTQLVLLYEGLTKRFVNEEDNVNRGKENIKTLQYHLKQNDVNLAIDGKFGIKTFNALREKFGEEPIKKKFSEKSVAVEPNQQQNTEVENSGLDLRISNNLEEVEVDYSDKEYFGLPDNTEIFKRDSYTGYYYRNGDSLYYIPNMINRNNSDHDCDKKPLIRKTSNGKQWENLYPTNSKNFSKYLQYTLSLADRDAKIVFDDNARSYKIEKNGLSVNIISKTLESGYFSKKDNFNMRLQGDLYLLSLSLDIQNAINNKNIEQGEFVLSTHGGNYIGIGNEHFYIKKLFDKKELELYIAYLNNHVKSDKNNL